MYLKNTGNLFLPCIWLIVNFVQKAEDFTEINWVYLPIALIAAFLHDGLGLLDLHCRFQNACPDFLEGGVQDMDGILATEFEGALSTLLPDVFIGMVVTNMRGQLALRVQMEFVGLAVVGGVLSGRQIAL